MAFEDATGGKAGDRPHQLDRVADRMGDRMEIGVPDIAPPGIVPQRSGASRMKPDRHIEPLEFVPEWLAGLVVQMLAVDRVGGADDRDGAQLDDTAAATAMGTSCMAICAANL